MGKLSAAALVTVLAVLASPAGARAQGLALVSERACYGPGERIELTGYGYTPDGAVRLSLAGAPLGFGYADYDGIFNASVRAPWLPFGGARLRFAATDQTYRLNRASTTVRVVSPRVGIRPRTGVPGRPRRIRASGFFDGRVLYAHVRRHGRARRTVRLGRLRGACRRVDVRRRLFSPRAPAGRYSIRFDTSRRPDDRGGRRVTYGVRIDPAPGVATTAAGSR